MAEFWLSYNPFTVETSLQMKKGDSWISVSEESGLLRISKMRMQRWLEPMSDNSYFDELREAVGEDNIDIFFSGTKEDMEDLKKAADSYSCSNNDVAVTITELGNVEENSCRAKMQQLRNILQNVESSNNKLLLPDSIWNYLSDCLNPPSNEAVLIPFIEWKEHVDEIFSIGSWKMICLSFPYEQMRTKQMRDLFFEFEKKLDLVSDRRFDRERFLFICHYEPDTNYLDNSVDKLFMEYGMQDMNVIALSNEEFENIDDVESASHSENYKIAQQRVAVFNERYAEQYRLRKMHDVVHKMFCDQELVKGPKLFRRVDEILREQAESSDLVTDKTVQNVYDWLSSFLDSIEHLIDIDAVQ